MRSRFENRTTNLGLNALINKANELLHHESNMMLEISSKDDFKYKSGKGIDIGYSFYKCDKTAPVFFYKPKWAWSKAMGYSDGKAIHLNSRKLNSFTEADIIGLLIHEYSHIAGFSHGNNYKTQEKCLYSVPYFLSENISKWL